MNTSLAAISRPKLLHDTSAYSRQLHRLDVTACKSCSRFSAVRFSYAIKQKDSSVRSNLVVLMGSRTMSSQILLAASNTA